MTNLLLKNTFVWTVVMVAVLTIVVMTAISLTPLISNDRAVESTEHNLVMVVINTSATELTRFREKYSQCNNYAEFVIVINNERYEMSFDELTNAISDFYVGAHYEQP